MLTSDSRLKNRPSPDTAFRCCAIAGSSILLFVIASSLTARDGLMYDDDESSPPPRADLWYHKFGTAQMKLTSLLIEDPHESCDCSDPSPCDCAVAGTKWACMQLGHGNDTCAWNTGLGCVNESMPTPDRECLLLRDNETCINATECLWEPRPQLVGLPFDEFELGVCRPLHVGRDCGGTCSYLNKTECRQNEQCSWDANTGCRMRSLGLGNGLGKRRGGCWWEVAARCRESRRQTEAACTGGKSEGWGWDEAGSECAWAEGGLGCHALCGATPGGVRCTCPQPEGSTESERLGGEEGCALLDRGECEGKPGCWYATATGCRPQPLVADDDDDDDDDGSGGWEPTTQAAPAWTARSPVDAASWTGAFPDGRR